MMLSNRLAGILLQHDKPDWGPLESLVGLALAPWFMWMHSVRLADDAVVHTYKHVSTRQYVHLAGDGRAFLFTSDGDCREVTRLRAIATAFEGWESLTSQPSDRAVVRAALRQAMNAERN